MEQKNTGIAGRAGFHQRGTPETGEKGLGNLIINIRTIVEAFWFFVFQKFDSFFVGNAGELPPER